MVDSIEEDLGCKLDKGLANLSPLAGKRIAVGVGSRGISKIDIIARTVVAALKRAGAKPFIIPAMGSHGGGTAEGQQKLLAGYGVTAETMGVPISATTETVLLGNTDEGVPVRIDKIAFEADGIVLINRVKPHTDFKGDIESGLMKMIAVGLGNPEGAGDFHSAIQDLEHSHVIKTKARLLLETGKLTLGVAIVENAYHETAHLHVVPSAGLIEAEREILVQAKSLMPSLPVGQADLLIIDRIGKDISGTGLDPNVTGRWFHGGTVRQAEPRITRIAVLDLSAGTGGNALGIGIADFCTSRAVQAMNREVTYTNSITAQNTCTARIPIYFDSDREMVEKAIWSLGAKGGPDRVRLIRIKDTLNLTRIEASEALLPELSSREQVSSIGELRPMRFDSEGRLPAIGEQV